VASSYILATQSVDYIIKRYCENYVGYNFIQRGEYRMIRAQDNQVITPSKFASIAGSGMKFEISIIMRQMEMFTKTCPQCGKSNHSVAANCGWIKWQVLPNSLHIAGSQYYVIDRSRYCSKQFEAVTKKCPRCRHINLNISVNDNWIEW
jgi:hypothetical protein